MNRSSHPDARPSTPARPDPRPSLAAVIEVAGATIAATRLDQYDDPTPCGDFDVRRLTGHLVGALLRLAAIARRRDIRELPDVVEGIADPDWTALWNDAATDAVDAWRDDELLDRDAPLPWATISGADVVALWVSELAVHTWDLAVATGQAPVWDDGALAVAYDAIRRLLPDEGRSERWARAAAELPPELGPFVAPFAEARPVGSEAPLIERLVAWNGRDPRWAEQADRAA